MKTIIALLFAFSLSAFAQSYTANLTWTNGAGPCSVPMTTNLYRSVTSGGQTTAFVTGIVGTSYADKTIQDGATYFYKVTNVCSTSKTQESAKSPETVAIVGPGQLPGPPAAPGAPTVTVTPNSASLSWPAVPGSSEYELWKSGAANRLWHVQTKTTALNFVDKTVRHADVWDAYYITAKTLAGISVPSAVVIARP